MDNTSAPRLERGFVLYGGRMIYSHVAGMTIHVEPALLARFEPPAQAHVRVREALVRHHQKAPLLKDEFVSLELERRLRDENTPEPEWMTGIFWLLEMHTFPVLVASDTVEGRRWIRDRVAEFEELDRRGEMRPEVSAPPPMIQRSPHPDAVNNVTAAVFSGDKMLVNGRWIERARPTEPNHESIEAMRVAVELREELNDLRRGPFGRVVRGIESAQRVLRRLFK